MQALDELRKERKKIKEEAFRRLRHALRFAKFTLHSTLVCVCHSDKIGDRSEAATFELIAFFCDGSNIL